MNFAVLQKDLAVPPVERLKVAFRKVPFLTDVDAHALAADAFGILVKRLPGDRAFALKEVLLAEGIETEVVEERQLPPLPATKFVQRMDVTAEGLVIYDPLNRSFRIEWQHLLLIAAGNVQMTDLVQNPTKPWIARLQEPRLSERPGEEIVETVCKEERNHHLALEIILTRGVQRFSATADRFNFGCLGDRLTRDTARNFVLLVQGLLRHAPQASLNRGAYDLRENAPDIFSYPSKNAFFEEITWLLWRLAQPAAG